MTRVSKLEVFVFISASVNVRKDEEGIPNKGKILPHRGVRHVEGKAIHRALGGSQKARSKVQSVSMTRVDVMGRDREASSITQLTDNTFKGYLAAVSLIHPRTASLP